MENTLLPSHSTSQMLSELERNGKNTDFFRAILRISLQQSFKAHKSANLSETQELLLHKHNSIIQ